MVQFVPMMAVRVFIMKKIKFLILLIIAFIPISLLSAEITLLECSYASGTKKIDGILNRELDSENKDYKPWDIEQKKYFEIDLEKEKLTWENLEYELVTITPSHLYFQYKGNNTPLGEKYNSKYDFSSFYTINRINLNVKMLEYSNDVEKDYGAISSMIKIERKL